MAACVGIPISIAHDRPEGQPFYTELLSALLAHVGDVDKDFPSEAARGMPLGVATPLEPAKGVWAYRDAFLDEDDDIPQGFPHTETNYQPDGRGSPHGPARNLHA